jgi:hypothetical protein
VPEIDPAWANVEERATLAPTTTAANKRRLPGTEAMVFILLIYC